MWQDSMMERLAEKWKAVPESAEWEGMSILTLNRCINGQREWIQSLRGLLTLEETKLNAMIEKKLSLQKENFPITQVASKKRISTRAKLEKLLGMSLDDDDLKVLGELL